MRTISETLSTPVTEDCEVLVAGGGIAGIAASLAAARAGARVLLLEREHILGGLATAGLITIYLPLCDGRGRQVSFGLSEELLRLSIRHGAQAQYPDLWLEDHSQAERAEGPRFQVQFNPHLFAIEVEKLLLASGVRILYGTQLCAVRRDAERITHAIIENKSGRSAIALQTLIDATGDADACHLAGLDTAPYAPGNALAAWYYALSDADGLTLRIHGVADSPDGTPAQTPLLSQRFDGIDAISRSDMMQQSHQETLKDILFRQRQDASYAPVTLPTIPQVRMTRRLSGAYTLDMDAAATPGVFDDSIGCIGNWRSRGPVYRIPYRTLYSPQLANLLVAGRCISVSDAMWDQTRVIPACAVTGEAAGIAAALAPDVRTLSIHTLQTRLTQAGVWLG